jgi:AsmA protein
MTSKFPVTVTADLPSGGKLKLDGTAGPIDQEDASLTPLNAKLDITSLNLASTGFVDSSAGLGGFSISTPISPRKMAKRKAGQRQNFKALFIAGGSAAGVPVTIDFDTKYNLRKNTGVLNPSTLKIRALYRASYWHL